MHTSNLNHHLRFQPTQLSLAISTDHFPDPDQIKDETDHLLTSKHRHRVKDESPESTVKPESPLFSAYHFLRRHLAKNSYDPPTWNKLIDIAEESGDLAKVKDAYQSLLQAYPNTVRFFSLIIPHIFVYLIGVHVAFIFCFKPEVQVAYLQYYLERGLFQNAEPLFHQFLTSSPPFVQFWKIYLTYLP